MLNREVYLKDPSSQKLVNEGVANVNDDKSKAAMVVLRYELETFVCDGQYDKGIAHILNTFLRNINEVQQPAVWVSGFFGSGKSHLVKVLRALWVDTVFDDGASARGVAALPDTVKDPLVELSTQGKRWGGLHAASGTLGAGASGSVRLALLRIIFKSVDLPENYAAAKFVIWLKKESIYEAVRELVESGGDDWDEELDNFFVADVLHDALMKIKPNLFSSREACVKTLTNLFPNVRDISSDEMINAIRQALSRDGKFPLTLVALDEVQQYIGEDSQRSNDVQEMVEACCKNIGSHLLFIGTGQSGVTGADNLKKLEGRFTVRVELSDTDVDAVIRKVVLAKNPAANKPIEDIMRKNLGEISRHLAGSSIAHRQEDIRFFSQDYPVLPVRRRFWEHTLRVLDRTGTDSQLRNQLAMIHEVIQTNLDKPLGTVIPADYLYFYSANRLLQNRILPRKLHEKTLAWEKGSAKEKLTARACGIVFLLNKFSGENKETGLRATADTIADLLVEDLSAGSGELRAKLPLLLKECKLLMMSNDEYRIQTEESSAWNDDFLAEVALLENQNPRIETERNERIKKKFAELYRKTTLIQGAAKVPRDITPVLDTRLPKDAGSRVNVWVRDGWNSDANSVKADARQAGNQSPTVFVFIPKHSPDELRGFLIEYKAASTVLDRRGNPNTPEGIEARSVVETTRQAADGKINELLNEAFHGAQVFQGGGNEVVGMDMQTAIDDAAANALKRLYPQFDNADNAAWAKIYEAAAKGVPDALKLIGDTGEADKNPVCREILHFIASGKRGADIREHFETAPFGWPRDAVDGALQVLLVSGTLHAQDDRGAAIHPKDLDRKNISRTFFKVVSTIITTPQRIQIRKLLQKTGINAKPNEELLYVPQFLHRLAALAESAGGDAPRPVRPDTQFIDELKSCAGNEQLLLLYNQAETISILFDNWTTLTEQIERRISNWFLLKKLAAHVQNLPDIEIFEAQIKTIEDQRQLLNEPDPVQPLLTSITQLLRDELNNLDGEYAKSHAQGMEWLEKDSAWQRLEPEQRHEILKKNILLERVKPLVKVQSAEDVLSTLNDITISSFRDRLAAMPSRFEAAVNAAAVLFEPQTQIIQVPRGTIRTEAELDAWLLKTKTRLAEAMKNGPIMIG
jgi:hypothetical protein